jgi:hypothetical protein
MTFPGSLDALKALITQLHLEGHPQASRELMARLEQAIAGQDG